MKRSIIVLVTLLLGVAGVFAQRTGGQGQAPPVALHKDRAPNQAALAKQEALEKATPQLQITEELLRPTWSWSHRS